MSRFVTVSFLFMGWAFYEASGGADFRPPDRPAQSSIVTAETEPAPFSKGRTISVSADELVNKVALQTTLGTRQTAPTSTNSPLRPKADPTLRTELAMAQIRAAGASLTDPDSAFDPTFQPATGQQVAIQPATVQLASLTDGLAGGLTGSLTGGLQQQDAEPKPDAEPLADIRRIKATRVNMRAGPGTAYAILKRLENGTEVRVLEDIGTGWLRLRNLDDGTVGWIAASLLSQKGS
ncbi:SH3 domain-containing protein [Phaeobacter sp.]|uniref:SH3 domain-containing protein n=1 Tax=Phaeobacter sp. TaxID=1902409 RepID=UPI0025F883DE|nr:SH3 domain-containing protein [Phaeobacter sp.]